MERLVRSSSPSTCFSTLPRFYSFDHSQTKFLPLIHSELRQINSIYCRHGNLSPYSSEFSSESPFHIPRRGRFGNHIFSIGSHVDLLEDESNLQYILPSPLDSSSTLPPLFDGTTRLYISYKSPFAQRVWITRNYKGLQDEIKLVPIDLPNRPSWYKEKVYPENKVPSLEHNNKVIGESLDLIKYVDLNFDGPSVYTDDPARKEFAEELLFYSETFNKIMYASFKGKREEAGPASDHLESALYKFCDGPFFLGHFSLVDIAYIPFVERLQIFLLDVWEHDITEGRPKLAAWIEEMNKIDAYKQTKFDSKELVKFYKRRFLEPSQPSN